MSFSKIKLLRYLIFSFFVSSNVGNEIIVKLTRDFIEEGIAGHVAVCYFVVCSETEKTNIIKEMSSTHECFIKIHDCFHDNISNSFLTQHHHLFIVEYSCFSSLRYLLQANSYGLLRSKHVFLLVHSLENHLHAKTVNSSLAHVGVMKDFENFELTISSQVYVALERFAKKFDLIGLYKRDPDDRMIKEDLKKWNFEEGFDDKKMECFAVRRQDLNGRLFNATIVLTDHNSLQHSEDLVDIHVDSLSKVNHAIVSLVALSLNSSVNYLVTASWGNKVNGTFDGQVGLVEKGKAEIAVTQSFPTKERMEVVEPIDKAVRTQSRYIFMSPPLSFKRNIFILPFDRYVWFSVVGLVLIIMPVIYYAGKSENRISKRRNYTGMKKVNIKRDFKKPNYFTWGEIFLLNVAAFCMQGYHVLDPTKSSGRMAVMTLFAMVIFLSVSYNAYITVLLRSLDKSIITLEDLFKSNLELGAYNISYNQYNYKFSSDPLRKAISHKVLSNEKREGLMTLEEGVKRVRTERFAFDAEESPSYQMVKKTFLEEEKCRLQVIRQTYMINVEPMLTVHKNSSYKEMLKIKFKHLHETGIVSRTVTRFYTKKPVCSSGASFHFSIGLADTHHIFEFLIFAMLASSIFLALEIFFFKNRLFQYFQHKTKIFAADRTYSYE